MESNSFTKQSMPRHATVNSANRLWIFSRENRCLSRIVNSTDWVAYSIRYACIILRANDNFLFFIQCAESCENIAFTFVRPAFKSHAINPMKIGIFFHRFVHTVILDRIFISSTMKFCLCKYTFFSHSLWVCAFLQRIVVEQKTAQFREKKNL